MGIQYKCDKRNTVHIKSDSKYYALGFDLYRIEKEGIKIPLINNAPNIIALLLNISDRALERAVKIYDKDLLPTLSLAGEDFEKHYSFTHKKHTELEFDLYENLFVSIVFAYSAVEAFVNNLIPKDFKYKADYKRGGTSATLICDTEYIGKNYSVEEKINAILPLLYRYDINSFKKDKSEEKICWEKFKRLIEYRHKIIHPKTKISKLKKFSQIRFIADIFIDGINKEITKPARDLIKILCKKVYNSPEEVIKSPHIPYEFAEELPKFQNYELF
ncbi:MAG: hypothetical protein ISS16_01670 [Ignavibacteria bacterium]|nr:hypothetical protein [Ignavibacteria bacterium]